MRQQDGEVLLAIKNAEAAYLECRNEIDSTLNKTECQSNWLDYQNCF